MAGKKAKAPITKQARIAARALIRDGDRVLTIRMRDDIGHFHILPGGGHHHGETLPEALRRECREEMGCEIEVGDLCYVREYIGRNHSFAHRHHHFHQVEVVYEARLCGEPCAEKASEKDFRQVAVIWLPVAELEEHRFLPAAVISRIREAERESPNRYLGDVN